MTAKLSYFIATLDIIRLNYAYGFTIFSAGGNLGRKDWYLDESKERSIYFSGFNLEVSIEISEDMKSEKDLFSVACSIFKFGYDGKFIDFNIALGLTQEYINIDIVAIIREIEDVLKNGRRV